MKQSMNLHRVIFSLAKNFFLLEINNFARTHYSIYVSIDMSIYTSPESTT